MDFQQKLSNNSLPIEPDFCLSQRPKTLASLIELPATSILAFQQVIRQTMFSTIMANLKYTKGVLVRFRRRINAQAAPP